MTTPVTEERPATRLVIVGREWTFWNWLHEQPPAERARVKPVFRLSDMWGLHDVVVEFMPDWTRGKTGDQCRAILREAEILTDRRARMMRPFQPPRVS